MEAHDDIKTLTSKMIYKTCFFIIYSILNLYKISIFLNIMKLKGNKGITIKAAPMLRDDLYNMLFIKILILYRDNFCISIRFHKDMDRFGLQSCLPYKAHS